MNRFLQKNLLLIISLGVVVIFLAAASQGMDRSDFAITLLRGLSVGALTFLVASGFSLIFGLLDVLNLAHGTLFMIGAYVGWTVYVRPDTFVDLLTPLALLFSGFLLRDVWRLAANRLPQGLFMRRVPAMVRPGACGVAALLYPAALSGCHVDRGRLCAKPHFAVAGRQSGADGSARTGDF